MRKKGAVLGIGISAFLILIILLFTTYYVMTRARNSYEIIDAPKIMDDLYIQVELLDYYLENSFENAAKEVGPFGREVFIERFLKELENYKVDGEYLVKGMDKVEEQVQNARFEDKIILDFDFDVVKGIETEEGFIVVKRDYKKKFEKEFG